MNAIKPKNTEVGSLFLKAWVFSAARKILSSHTHWAVHVQSLLWKFLFLGILLEDFKEDASVFVTVAQMKPERCEKAEKKQEPYKILQHNPSSCCVHFPLLCWALLTENFPCGGSQSRRVSWWSILSTGRAAEGGCGMRTVFDLWPVPRSGQPEKITGMEHIAFAQHASPPSKSIWIVPLLKEWKIFLILHTSNYFVYL